jgi:MFS family permease
MTENTRTDEARQAQRLTFVAFGVFGAMFGAWQVLIADLQLALDLSPGEFGLAVTLGFVASFPVMFFGGRLVDRFGVRPLLIGTALGMAVAFLGIAFVQHYIFLVLLTMIFFGSSGGYDVAINATAVGVEQTREVAILPYFHAAFSGFAAVIALGTGIALFFALPFRAVFLLVALMLATFAVIVWRSPYLDQLGVEPATDATELRGFQLPNRGAILPLAVIALLTFLTEGALETWSATYLRLTLDFPPILGAAAPATFHIAMMLGRLTSGRLINRRNRYLFLRLAGVSAAVGMVIALATTQAPIILFGILIAGLSLAGVVPVVFSLAGDLAPGHVGRASALITTIGYSGFLIGPSLIGGLAEALTLRGGLGVLILVTAAILPLNLLSQRRKAA